MNAIIDLFPLWMLLLSIITFHNTPHGWILIILIISLGFILNVVLKIICHLLNDTCNTYCFRPNGDWGGWPSGHAQSLFLMWMVIVRRYGLNVWTGGLLMIIVRVLYLRYQQRYHTGFQIISGGVIGLSLGWGLLNLFSI